MHASGSQKQANEKQNETKGSTNTARQDAASSGDVGNLQRAAVTGCA